MSEVNQYILQLKQVSKKIGKQTIVDQLSFNVSQGEIVGLLGPNGAGKTTTIRMIVGLISMSEGDIVICGKSVKSQFSDAVRHLGAIVENPEFYGYMTGLDNLKQFQRMSAGVTDERIEEVVDIVGMKDAMHKKVKSYSLGMRQRLGIAQALLHKPSILILDEPTNGLDPAGIREMRDYLKKIAEEEKIAILVSSHLLSEMELMCSRVIVIQHGRFVQEQKLIESAEAVQTIAIKVSDDEAAKIIIQQITTITPAAAKGQVILQATDEQAATIVKQLVEAGVSVYRVEAVKQSLEDEFLKWTGGNQIV